MITADFESKANKKASDFAKPFMSKENAANTEAINNLTNSLKNPTAFQDHTTKLTALLTGKTSLDLANNSNNRESILKTLETYKIEGFDEKKLSTQA